MCFNRYADIVDVGDSVLIENQNKMIPAKVEHTEIQAYEGIHDAILQTL